MVMSRDAQSMYSLFLIFANTYLPLKFIALKTIRFLSFYISNTIIFLYNSKKDYLYSMSHCLKNFKIFLSFSKDFFKEEDFFPHDD